MLTEAQTAITEYNLDAIKEETKDQLSSELIGMIRLCTCGQVHMDFFIVNKTCTKEFEFFHEDKAGKWTVASEDIMYGHTDDTGEAKPGKLFRLISDHTVKCAIIADEEHLDENISAILILLARTTKDIVLKQEAH
jgi:hypothetical protein